MNSLDAVRLMVRHYPGGLDAVALRLDKSPSTLDKELRGAPGYKLGVLDASAIATMCIELGCEHSMAWLNAEAVNCGVRVQLLDGGNFPVLDPMQATSAAVREMADVMVATAAGMADGAISRNDRARIQREITEAMDALQQAQRAVDAAERKATRHD